MAAAGDDAGAVAGVKWGMNSFDLRCGSAFTKSYGENVRGLGPCMWEAGPPRTLKRRGKER